MLKKTIRVLNGFSVIMLALALVACGSVEEKKMKFFDKGKVLFEKGDYVKARLEFKNALQIDSKFAEAYEMLGRVEMKMKNPKGAFAAFSKAVALDPGLMDSQIILGKILMASGQPEKAQEKADLVLQKSPENTDGLMLKAVCLLKLKRPLEARDILTAMIQKDPKLPGPYLLMADSYNQEDNPGEAEKMLMRLLDQDAQNIRARLLLAGIAEKQKDLKAAENHYRILAAQGDEQFKLLLSRFYARNNQDAKAENILQELINAHPGEMSYRLALASFLKSKGQREAMVEVLQKSIKDNPEAYKPCEMLALTYSEEEHYDEALQVMDRFMDRVKTGPEFLRAKLVKATIYFKEKKMDDAFGLVQAVLSENPKDVQGPRPESGYRSHKGRLRGGHFGLPLCSG